MKKIASCFLLLLFEISISACEYGFAVDRTARMPQIKSMTIPGVPNQDIRIDHEASTITIRLPAFVPKDGLIPVFELTGKAVVKVSDGSWPTAQGKLPISHLATCDWGTPEKPFIEIIDESIKKPYFNSNIYLLKYIKPAACLEPIDDLPIGYSLGGNSLHVFLPVKNLYSNPRINSLYVKNLATGLIAGSVLTEGVCANTNYTKVDGRNINIMYNYLDVPFVMKTDIQFMPGTYEVSIVLDCNKSTITFPQPLVIE